jgi:hypothetical protein
VKNKKKKRKKKKAFRSPPSAYNKSAPHQQSKTTKSFRHHLRPHALTPAQN